MSDSSAHGANAVSVVIPTHNRADHVAATVESVLTQTSPPNEVVVVDDCSTDKTPEVLAAFGDAIRVVRPDENVERGAARNLGARLSSGALLAFLDSDDRWEPEKLHRQLRRGSAFVPSVTGVRWIDEDREAVRGAHVPSARSQRQILVENWCLGSGSSLLLPREAFVEVGGFPEERVYSGSEDWMLLVKLHWAGWPIVVVPDTLLACQVHRGASTQSATNLERSMWAVCGWLEAQRQGRPSAVPSCRSRAATSIACAFIAGGAWRRAVRWVATALKQGGVAARCHAAWRITRSSLGRLLRRSAPSR